MSKAAVRLFSVRRWSHILLRCAHSQSPEIWQNFTRIIQSFAESNPLLLPLLSDDLVKERKVWPVYLQIQRHQELRSRVKQLRPIL